MRAQVQLSRKFAVVAAVAIVCVFSGAAMAANKLIVKGTDGTTDKFVVTDGGYLGIATSAPIYPLQIKGAGATGTTTIEFHNQGNTTYSPYDSPAFQLMRNNNASATGGNGSTIPRSGDRLGNFAFGSYLEGYARYSAFVSGFAQGTWTNSSYPGYLSFQTTGSADVYPVERLRIQSTGNVGVGTGNPSQRLEVNGGVRLNTSTSRPSCDANSRGTIWFTRGATGVADALEVCAKGSDENYSWRSLF